jgi:hypothetical protein
MVVRLYILAVNYHEGWLLVLDKSARVMFSMQCVK